MNTNRPLLFLDMDGVIADFNTGVCKAHNVPFPYDNPAHRGVWDMQDLWKMTASEFWAPCNNDPEFWDSLGKMHDADRIIELACQFFRVDEIAILTAPSNDPQCVPGKRRWMQRYYPLLAGNMIFAKKKHFLAGPDRILIDDKPENVNQFTAAGGIGIYVPRPWNHLHDLSNETVPYLYAQLYAWACSRFLDKHAGSARSLTDLGAS